MPRPRVDMVDDGRYPKIECAALGDYYPLGDGRIRFLFYDLFRIRGILRPKVTGSLTRPLLNLTEDQLWVQRGIINPGATTLSLFMH